MKNKLFSLLIVLEMGTLMTYAEVYSGTCGSNLTWSLNTEDSTLVINGAGQMNNFTNWGTNIAPWYKYRESLVYISLPQALTTIGSYAFNQCAKLKEISIPDKVTSIGDYAFYECSGLLSADIGSGVVYIGHYAFTKCTSLTSIAFSNSLKEIGSAVFNQCTKLSNITFGNELVNIGSEVFYGCQSLISINLPSGLQNIGNNTFAHSGLTQVTIPDEVTTLPYGLFYGCPNLETVQVGTGVTTIMGGCFAECPKLKEVSIPDNVTTVASDAFTNCDKLISPICNAHIFARLPKNYQGAYTIQTGVETILESAFAECKGVTEVIIPNSVTEIGTWAFLNCTNLQKIVIPENVTEVKNETFVGCTSLAEVSLPSGLHIIAEGAFSGCSALQEITIPEDVYALGVGAFSLSGITTIHWNAKHCSCVISFNECSNNYPCPIHDLTDQLSVLTFGDEVEYIPEQMCYDQHLIQSIELPASLTHIGNFAFAYCSLLETVTIPAGVVEIGRDAFDGCPEMKSINVAENNENYSSIDGVLFNKTATRLLYFPGGRDGDYVIPDGTKTIGQMAFDKNNLSSVTIPDGVDSLLMYSFAFSNRLSDVYFKSVNPPYIEVAAFDNDYCYYHVPCESVNTYAEVLDGKNTMYGQQPIVAQIKPDCDYVLVTDFHFVHQHANCENRVVFSDDSYVAIRNSETGELTPSSLEPMGHLWNFGYYPEYSYSSDDSPSYTYPSYGGSYTVEMQVYFNEDLYDIVTKTIELPDLHQVFDTIESSVEEGQPIVLGGKTIYPTGSLTWNDTLQSIYGCDSIVTHIITVQESSVPEADYRISYVDNILQEISHETTSLHFPDAPLIEGFSFVGWRPVAAIIENNTIKIEAVYTANVPTSAPAEVVNPANPAQKLIRNGNVYILTDTKTYTVQGLEVR